MKYTKLLMMITLILLIVASCSNNSINQDLVNSIFEEEQEQIKEVVNTIVRDAEMANLEGLKNSH